MQAIFVFEQIYGKVRFSIKILNFVGSKSFIPDYIQMENKKVLFISQEITPYLPESEISQISRYLPQGIQEKGKEIRTFMPRYGNVNERRNQLHEVIRLSGMNLIIDDTDHPLIIKVASIQSARMQVYFIDNEDYFGRKHTFSDNDGVHFQDNDERAIFFARGVLETVRKLRWSPDIIHCHGWFTALVPLYVKKALKQDPIFDDSKVVYSLYNDSFEHNFSDSFRDKIIMEGIEEKDLKGLDKFNYSGISKLAIQHSDAVVIAGNNVDSGLINWAEKNNKKILKDIDPDTYIETYSGFYDSL